MEAIYAALKEAWVFLALVVGHIVRTEQVRTRHSVEIANIKERHSENMRRVDDSLREISKDVKQLLQRDT